MVIIPGSKVNPLDYFVNPIDQHVYIYIYAEEYKSVDTNVGKLGNFHSKIILIDSQNIKTVVFLILFVWIFTFLYLFSHFPNWAH